MTLLHGTAGLDIGTTSVKALVVDQFGETRYRISKRIQTNTTQPGMATQHPLDILVAIQDVMSAAVKEAKQIGVVLQAVGFSAAMHSLIAVSDDGTPRTEAMTWMDIRSKEQAYTLWQSDVGKSFYRKTGTPIHAMSPFVKLCWLRQQDASLFETSCRFVSIKEWVWHAWFGEWVIDESMASATGLYDVEKRHWADEVLQYVGIQETQLSKVVPVTHSCSKMVFSDLYEVGLPPTATFHIGGSDGVLANLALGVTNGAEMVLTAGTSLAVRTGSEKMVTDALLRPFCYRYDENGFIVGAPSNSGGIVLDWLTRQVFRHDEHSDTALQKLIQEAGDVSFDGLYCLPYIAGERAPLWNENARASFIGLHLEHGQAHIVRAALEGILFNAYQLISNLSQQTGTPKQITVSGRIFEESWIHQFCADLFRCPIRQSQLEDASTIGAIILAANSDELTMAIRNRDHGVTRYPIPDNTTRLRDRFAQYKRFSDFLLSDA